MFSALDAVTLGVAESSAAAVGDTVAVFVGMATILIGADGWGLTWLFCQAESPHHMKSEWNIAAAIALLAHTERGV
ncbi:MAG: hypothetical protein F6K00_19085 [Leptolyngbya sp. SIOISBB]|nr:hypothetical protein [Leptolyngbya sp. SIOISBB]